MIAFASNNKLEAEGLSFHVGSQCTNPENCNQASAATAIAQIIGKIIRKIIGKAVRGGKLCCCQRTYETACLSKAFSFFTRTFEFRPLWSYFSRRSGGRSSGVPSSKPPFNWKKLNV